MEFKFALHVDNMQTILFESADYFKNSVSKSMLQTRGTAKRDSWTQLGIGREQIQKPTPSFEQN
jgi:hypothetical protein